MGKVSLAKVIVLTCLLAATAAMVQFYARKRDRSIPKESLQRALSKIPGWHVGRDYAVSAEVADALRLDDVVFQSYSRGQDQVTLYIGYYRTAAKVGAAHDPLVCFYGQGWQIKERDKGKHLLQADSSRQVHFATMIVEQSSNRELLLYWFQTNGTTSPDTLSQKFAMLQDRLRGAGEESAFVRISTTIGSEPTEAAQARMLAFVDDFYPVFQKYVVGN